MPQPKQPEKVHQIDDATYRLLDRKDFLVGTDTLHPVLTADISPVMNTLRITSEMQTDVTANRAIPYKAFFGD